jgi:beta-glucanase (GH16 family)
MKGRCSSWRRSARSGQRRLSWKRRWTSGLVAALASVAAWGSVGQSQLAGASTSSTPSPPAAATGRWNLTFNDEFTGSRPTLRRWSTCYDWACTNAGNDELEWYEKKNVTVSGGALRLTARAQSAYDKPYTSGMIQSNHHYVFRYGFAEVRAKVPAGTGLWSAFWLLPSNKQWPPEIDVVEIYGSQPRVASMTLHDLNQVTQQSFNGPNYSNGYHTFGVDWEPGSISWYIDGVLRQRVIASIDTPMYLLADLAVQGGDPPTPLTPFPSAMAIQWIRVWQHPNGV